MYVYVYVCMPQCAQMTMRLMSPGFGFAVVAYIWLRRESPTRAQNGGPFVRSFVTNIAFHVCTPDRDFLGGETIRRSKVL